MSAWLQDFLWFMLFLGWLPLYLLGYYLYLFLFSEEKGRWPIKSSPYDCNPFNFGP